jgi:hypothetical protein
MNPIWREVLLLTLFQVAAICFCVGLYLLLSPRHFLETTSRFNRWIATDDAFDALDRPRAMDRFFYRHHVLTGLLVAAGSAYIVYMFWFWFATHGSFARLPVIHSQAASEWLYESALIFFRVAGIFGVLVGLVIILRPSLLKGIEAWGNRWVGTERLAKSLDRRKELPASWFPGRPRVFATGILAGSAYILYVSAHALWGIG